MDGSSLCLQCDMSVHVGGKRKHGRYLLLRQRVKVCLVQMCKSCILNKNLLLLIDYLRFYSFQEMKQRIHLPTNSWIQLKTRGNIANREIQWPMMTSRIASSFRTQKQMVIEQLRWTLDWLIWMWSFIAKLQTIHRDKSLANPILSGFTTEIYLCRA